MDYLMNRNRLIVLFNAAFVTEYVSYWLLASCMITKIICQLQKHLTKGFLNYSSFLYINQPYLMGIYRFHKSTWIISTHKRTYISHRKFSQHTGFNLHE